MNEGFLASIRRLWELSYIDRPHIQTLLGWEHQPVAPVTYAATSWRVIRADRIVAEGDFRGRRQACDKPYVRPLKAMRKAS